MTANPILRTVPSLLTGGLALVLGACSSTGDAAANDRGDVRDVTIHAAPYGDVLDVEQLARELRGYDVVFLGELHDSLSGHRVMTELTAAILEGHPAPIVSMEMFERDVQDVVSAYVDGVVGREFFIAHARPWNVRVDEGTGSFDTSGYDAHYGPVVEMAKARDWDVIAANVPRRDARAVNRGENVDPQPSVYASPRLDLAPGRYRTEFDAVMQDMGGGHGSAHMDTSRMYAAQVLKDETMARAIARLYDRDAGNWPRVVHWNGRFHSDWGLGTVERLRALRPMLRIAVVSMARGDGSELARSDDPPAAWIIDVP